MNEKSLMLFPTEAAAEDWAKRGTHLLADYIDALIHEHLMSLPPATADLSVFKSQIREAMTDKDIAFHALRSLMFHDEASDKIARTRIAQLIPTEAR